MPFDVELEDVELEDLELEDLELEELEPEEMVAAGVAAAENDACFNMETPLFGNSHPAGTMPQVDDKICALHHTHENVMGIFGTVARTRAPRAAT
jgi:hypothetical protein